MQKEEVKKMWKLCLRKRKLCMHTIYYMINEWLIIQKKKKRRNLFFFTKLEYITVLTELLISENLCVYIKKTSKPDKMHYWWVILNLHYLLLIHKVFYVFIRTSHTDIDSCVYLTEHKAIKIIQSFILFFFFISKKNWFNVFFIFH
jgi:hypothetical protein